MQASTSKETPDINRVLADISGALVGQFEISALLEQVVDTSMRTLHAEVCSIFLRDREGDPEVVTMRAGSGFAAKLVGKARYRIGEGFTGTIAKYGRKFNIKSREELEHLTVDGERVWRGKFDGGQWPSGQSEFRNCIALPSKIKDEILGVIKVENKRIDHGGQFTETDEQYIETMANVVALAVENVRLHAQTENQLKTIAAKAAHRINNQITNYDAIELDLDDQASTAIPDKPKLREMAQRIATTTRSLKRMVGEFKNYGKPLVIEKIQCDVNGVVKNEVWLAKPPRNITISDQLDPSLSAAPLDAGRFAEAIKELLKNSIKAIGHASGHIEIATTQRSASSDGHHSLIEVKISDSGPGFPPLFPVFEPFQSTDPQSTGLGLATVKELIEAHGGSVSASSGGRAGAVIILEIPL
jgi:signal transduction histidine kinase